LQRTQRYLPELNLNAAANLPNGFGFRERQPARLQRLCYGPGTCCGQVIKARECPAQSGEGSSIVALLSLNAANYEQQLLKRILPVVVRKIPIPLVQNLRGFINSLRQAHALPGIAAV
jgi:hypothetical protein